MNEDLLRSAARLRSELAELARVATRIDEGWRRAQSSADDYYLDSVALNLHGLYSGRERIFVMIATVMDMSLPEGSQWHHLLLRQMTQEIPGVRPAVISEATCALLDEYRGFRHVVRNVYALELDPNRIEPLVKKTPALFAQVSAELLALAALLEQQASSNP
jgi:hypothetical protein